jgi:DNA-binding transcriptional ArsR family regulator
MTPDQLSTIFGALADPTRRAILARLADGDAPVTALTAPFAMSQPAISRHLKVLERAGLVSRSRQGTTRLSHLEAEPLRQATEWLLGYREYWTESYERLDELLASLASAPGSAPAAIPVTSDERSGA